MKQFHKKLKLSVWQFLAIGYLIVIAVGSLLLYLPISSKEPTSYINALFVSTSATCVTGLVPYDTNTHWSIFGQVIIILLIQMGGLGFMTFVSLLITGIGKKMKIHERKAFMQSVGELRSSGIKKMLRRIVLGTLIFEGVGAIFLSFRFIPDFGVGKGIYYSIWHSISAFCNAGFDLMGGVFGDKYASFTHYATDPLVSLTLCFLIIIGGIGFCVWSDLFDCKFCFKKTRLHTKLILIVNGCFLLVSTALYLLFERNNPTYVDYNFGERLLVSFFNATSPRTAGFNTSDLTSLSNAGYLTTIILMFIGGNSGSTAGGIKIGTIAVLFMGMISVFRGKKDINIGKRRIDFSLVNNALAIFVSCLTIVLVATLLILGIEPNLGFKEVLFETFSALGTVGLSLSLTPILSVWSKIVIMILMFLGRVGILTIALSIGETKNTAKVRRPLEDVLIG